MTSSSGDSQSQQASTTMSSAMAAIIPLLPSLPTTDQKEKSDTKQSRYLVSKGLPPLSAKLVERVWALDFVDMEDFLPATWSLRLVDQRSSAESLQESLVGALDHFQAIRQQQKSQRKVLDTTTWIKCFTLYVATMSKKKGAMVPCMVAHMHTVLKLFQKAPDTSAWLEYDVQFRMEAAASEDREWSTGDPWKYVACLPGQPKVKDAFSMVPHNLPLPDAGGGPPKQSQSAWRVRGNDHGIGARTTKEGHPSKNPRNQGSAVCLTGPQEAVLMAGTAFLPTGAQTVGQPMITAL